MREKEREREKAVALKFTVGCGPEIHFRQWP